MIRLRTQYEVLSAVRALESIEQEVVEWAGIGQVAKCYHPFHRPRVYLFDITVIDRLSDGRYYAKQFRARPKTHVFVESIAA